MTTYYLQSATRPDVRFKILKVLDKATGRMLLKGQYREFEDTITKYTLAAYNYRIEKGED